MKRCGILLATLTLLTSIAVPAAAQGHKGSPPGQQKKQPAPVAVSPASSAARVAYLGSWLDDATVLRRGEVWLALSTDYWRSAMVRQIDLPIVDVAAGLAPRLQAGMAFPVYHVRDQAGNTASGIAQLVGYGKLSLVEASETSRRVGVAFAPVIEYTSAAADPTGLSHVSLGVPICLEVRRKATRVYGSAGYFSRGALFGAGAIEASLSPRVTVTATLGHAYSTSVPSPTAQSRHRTDISLSTNVLISSKASIFGGAGRSLMGTGASSPSAPTGYWLGGGVALFFSR